MTPEGSGTDREELEAFLATAPEHLKGWAGEQLARLEAQGGPGEAAEAEAELEAEAEPRRSDGEDGDGGQVAARAGDQHVHGSHSQCRWRSRQTGRVTPASRSGGRADQVAARP